MVQNKTSDAQLMSLKQFKFNAHMAAVKKTVYLMFLLSFCSLGFPGMQAVFGFSDPVITGLKVVSVALQFVSVIFCVVAIEGANKSWVPTGSIVKVAPEKEED